MRKWHLLRSLIILDTKWLRVLKNAYQLPSGQVIEDYYVVARDDFVLVVAIEDETLILVRQYRPATDNFYVSVPAGYLSPGEMVEDAARRELLEETGYRASSTRLIGVLHPLPGYVRSAAHVVLCSAVSEPMASFDRQEIEQVMRVPWKDALEMVVNGEIYEMQAASAILLAWKFLDGEQAERERYSSNE